MDNKTFKKNSKEMRVSLNRASDMLKQFEGSLESGGTEALANLRSAKTLMTEAYRMVTATEAEMVASLMPEEKVAMADSKQTPHRRTGLPESDIDTLSEGQDITVKEWHKQCQAALDKMDEAADLLEAAGLRDHAHRVDNLVDEINTEE
jgi:hypothetical protein